ncbi:MAG: hypothetical protein ACI4OY_09425 [Aristaeellaceae bacterium]
MKRIRMPKINSIHFGGVWLGLALFIGGVLPLACWLMLRVIPWPLCAAGGVMLLGFAIFFAVEMHQDFGRAPYYERHLAEDIPFDPQSQEAVIRVSACMGETIAGFRSRESGSFTEVMVLRSAEEMRFMRMYGLDSVRREY